MLDAYPQLKEEDDHDKKEYNQMIKVVAWSTIGLVIKLTHVYSNSGLDYQ